MSPFGACLRNLPLMSPCLLGLLAGGDGADCSGPEDGRASSAGVLERAQAGALLPPTLTPTRDSSRRTEYAPVLLSHYTGGFYVGLWLSPSLHRRVRRVPNL